MEDPRPPTLADDEAALAGYASALADAFESIASSWLARLVDERARGLTSTSAVAELLDTGAALTVHELRALLARDISEQTVGPLEVLRRAVRFPTEVLHHADVPPRSRDEFATTNFPDDLYDLTPASFADVHPSLHEPGLTWGAAKAHVHLRRRREATNQ